MALATLDQDGNINSPSKIADRLMAYFFASDFSQSTASYGNISSLPAIIQKNTNNPDECSREISVELNKLFTPFYDNVEFEVKYKLREENDVVSSRGKYDVYVYATLTKDGIDYSLANLLEITNNKLNNVSELES